MKINEVMQNIFSVKNNASHKVVTLLGFKFKFRNKYLMLQKYMDNLADESRFNRKCFDDIYTNFLEAMYNHSQRCEEIKDYLVLKNSIYYYLPSISKQHEKVFPKYKEINRGKDVVIIATGPSLRDFKPLKDVIYFGVNRAFEYDKVDFDYLFLQDYENPTPEYIDKYVNYRKGYTKKFLGMTDYEYFRRKIIPEKYFLEDDVERYYLVHHKRFEDFTYDISSLPLSDYGSIVFQTMQIALWTHPRRIYIVGCDCNMNGYYNGRKKKLTIDLVLEGWHKMKEFRDAYYPDVEIISINPVGLKGLFKDEYQNEVVNE